MRGTIPDAVLARVSVIMQDRTEAMATIEKFTRDLLAAVSPKARRVLIGPS